MSLELESQLERLGRVRERGEDLKAFDRALKDIDPRLSLVRAKEDATEVALVPGYWHVRRHNEPPAMDSYLPLTDPDGNFSEPFTYHLDWLRSRDLQNERAFEALKQEIYEQERARQRASEAFYEDRRTEFHERYKAYANPGVRIKRKVQP